MYATVQRIIRENAGGSYNWKPGDIVQHPDGYRVRIDSGQYLSGGRVSNHWYWTRLNAHGKPCGKQQHGYGWDAVANV